jgi:putative NADPH-quinone reductase
MNVLVILAHPNPRSFNHAIAQSALQALQQLGHTVVFHELYQEKFDPILTIEEITSDEVADKIVLQHCRELAAADGIIIIHPNWWGQPPAILKGWIDRVIRTDIAYRFDEGDNGEGIPIGLLKAQKALVFNTADTNLQREQKTFGDPLELEWRNCIFGLCGVKNVYRRTFTVVVTSTEQQRKEWLKEVSKTIETNFQIAK